MSRLHVLLVVGISAVAGADCARQTDPVGYSHAFATPDCAPWDGPAVVLYLLDSQSAAVPPVTRHVRVAIYKGRAELAHHTFRWPANPQPGAAAQCSSAGSCEAATDGRVAFGLIGLDGPVEGELDLRFANGDRVRQAFKAIWQPRRIGCG